jgi:phosphoglycerol transferase MdoB-like AlkP superfamily enzyme
LYCHEIKYSCSTNVNTATIITALWSTFPSAHSMVSHIFLLINNVGFLQTYSQAAILFCLKEIYHSYQTNVLHPRLHHFSNANSHTAIPTER